MSINHPSLASGRWHTFTLHQQLAHVGSEISRMFHWKEKGDTQSSLRSAGRALELLDLLIEDPRWQIGFLDGTTFLQTQLRLAEILRLKEVVTDIAEGKKLYTISEKTLKSYLLPFAIAASKTKAMV